MGQMICGLMTGRPVALDVLVPAPQQRGGGSILREERKVALKPR